MKLFVWWSALLKIQVNPFMAQDEPLGAKIIPKCILWVRGLVPFWVLRHSFLSLTDCWWLYNSQLKTSRGVLFLPPSDAYVRSFLYLLYTLINLYYTKALNDQASSLALDWILLLLLLRGPRIPASWFNNNLSYSNHKETFFSIWCCVYLRWWMFTKPTVIFKMFVIQSIMLYIFTVL